MSVTQKSETPVYKFSFTGGFSEVFLLTLKNTLFTICTFGIYLPYARTNMRKYIWKSSKLEKQPFLFLAEPRNLMKGYLILGLILIGASFLSGALQVAVPTLAPLFKLIPAMVIFGFTIRARYGAYAYLVNNTSYRSIRFHANKEGMGPYVGAMVKGFFLSIITLGLYAPCVSADLTRIKWQNTSFGNIPFRFKMSNWDYALHCYKNFFLCLITFGLYVPWAAVSLHKFKMKHLSYNGARFYSKATGLSFFGTQIKCMLLLVFSLGLAFPYVMNMMLAFYLNNLRMKGDIDFNGILQNSQISKGGNLSDSVADVFDVDVDVA